LNDASFKGRVSRSRAYLIATRPHFILAYLIISLGAVVMGSAQDFGPIDGNLLILSLATIIIAAIGVHFRDEASDWDNGYDFETGGMGVIRVGILAPYELRRWGIAFNVVAFLLIAYQVIIIPKLLFVAVPASVILIWPNFLTEEFLLGHELFTSFSYWTALMWTYLAQGWDITMSILVFSTFIFIITFALVPLQDIGDVEADKKSGKKTLAARLGIDAVGHLSIFVALFSLMILYYAILLLV